MIHDILSSDLAWRVGWTLLHSLWQVLLIWAVIGVTLALLARQSANARYLVACCGMAVTYLPLAATFLLVPSRPVANVAAAPVLATEALDPLPVEQPAIEPPEPMYTPSASALPVSSIAEPVDAADTESPTIAPSSPSKLAEVVSPWLPWIVGTWLIGVMLLALWNAGGWVVVQRLRNRAILPVGQHAQQRLAYFVERLRISRPVRLVGSLLVETPTVIGWLRPVILLPANLVTGLTPAELDAILAHELAHIRRHDYLVNLLQAVTETVLFYHPAVWLVSRRIRIEREFCCDDAAITACGNKTGYIRALAAIEHGRATPVPAMSFLGRNKNMTLHRIRRILGRSPSTRHAWLAGAGALFVPLLLVALVGTALLQSGLFAAPDRPAPRVPSEDVRGNAPSQPADVGESGDGEPSRNESDVAEQVDLKQFRLILTHHGESDKPFYNLTLSVPPLAVRESPENLFVAINEEQAAPIAKWLAASQFFHHARVTETQNDPTEPSSQYLLRVRIGDKHYEESLGWDPGTIARLDALRKMLDGEAAKSMDVLLGRLAGQRKAWESGEAVNSLTTRLTTRIAEETNTFTSGRPIPVEVHIKNVSSEEQQYVQLQMHGSDFVVTNEHGRRVPLLGGYIARKASPTTIKPGETELIGTIDLSIDHYLRRPGRYAVSFRSYGMPPSNSFPLTVESHAAGNADGDPAGRLLSLESAKWSLLGSTNLSKKIRPGSNRMEVPGWQFQFFDRAKGIKMSKAIVWLWLTDEAAEEVAPPASDYLPVSESLGKVSKWNAYLYASPEALKVWPTVKEDIKKALENDSTQTSTGPDEAAVGDDGYRALHDRYKALILPAAKAGKTVEIAKLSDEFNASIGGKLLFVQVTSRTGPIADHKTVFSKFFDPQRKISPGKLHFAVSDKPIVTHDLNGQGCVMIATNPLANNKWPDDLQAMLLVDPVEAEVLRKAAVSTSKDGSSAKPLKAPQWGEPTDGFRARLVADKQVFDAGEPIPMKIEIENVAADAKDYAISVMPAEQSVAVVDEKGQTVHQLSPLYRVSVGASRLEKLNPGQSLDLASFDLSELYYLRKPGRYTASWPGKPGSASFEFEVAANPARAAADGDPVGRLLPLMKKGWWLGAGPREAKFQPGRTWSEGKGRIVTFVHNPPSYRNDAGHIWLSLMDEALTALPPDTESSKPEAEYLGKIAQWHVYYLASESAPHSLADGIGRYQARAYGRVQSLAGN